MRINKKYEALPFSMQEIGPLIKDFISKEKQVAITVTGNSMSPFLKDKRDKAVLSPITRTPQKDDVVLYLRDNGTYVLHRIFKVKENEYIMLGDAQVYLEKGITDRHIIAVATAFERKGKQLNCNNFLYLCYIKLWRFLYPFRLLKTKGVNFLKRTFKN